MVQDHPLRHESPGHGGLVLPGRRAQALGRGLRPLQPRASSRFRRPADGWVVPEKDQHDGDYKGLKMRIPNLGGKVYAKAGATTVLTPGGEIYAALERGVIDAAEWVGPHEDMKLGLHKTARYYYYPGWHEPGTVNEFGFNKKAYEALPADLRRMLDHAAAAVQVYGLTDYHAKNVIAPRAAQDGIQGQGRDRPVPGAGAARSQEAGRRGHQEGVGEEPHGQEGARVVHEVPGASSAPGTMSRTGPTISSSSASRRYPRGAGKMTERRRFIAKAGGVLAAVAAAALVDAPNIIAQPKVQWRMSTAWPKRSTSCRARPSAWARSSTR